MCLGSLQNEKSLGQKSHWPKTLRTIALWNPLKSLGQFQSNLVGRYHMKYTCVSKTCRTKGHDVKSQIRKQNYDKLCHDLLLNLWPNYFNLGRKVPYDGNMWLDVLQNEISKVTKSKVISGIFGEKLCRELLLNHLANFFATWLDGAV